MGVVVRGRINERGFCVAEIDVIAPFGVLPRESATAAAMIDTGAEATFISAGLAHRIQLPYEGVEPVVIPFRGNVDCMTTAADIVFHEPGDSEENRQGGATFTTELIVADGDFEGGFEVIIGVDLMKDGLLRVDYRKHLWNLTVPS